MRIRTLVALLLAIVVAMHVPAATATEVVSITVEDGSAIICVLESLCIGPEGVCFTGPEPDDCIIIPTGSPCVIGGVCPEPPPCFPMGCRPIIIVKVTA